MNDKELQEWEAEAKEASQDVAMMSKVILIMLFIGSMLYMSSNIKTMQNQLDVIEENTANNTVDSLQMEIMTIGHELDSMKLKYDY
jgi:hypothetical protein